MGLDQSLLRIRKLSTDDIKKLSGHKLSEFSDIIPDIIVFDGTTFSSVSFGDRPNEYNPEEFEEIQQYRTPLKIASSGSGLNIFRKKRIVYAAHLEDIYYWRNNWDLNTDLMDAHNYDKDHIIEEGFYIFNERMYDILYEYEKDNQKIFPNGKKSNFKDSNEALVYFPC